MSFDGSPPVISLESARMTPGSLAQRMVRQCIHKHALSMYAHEQIAAEFPARHRQTTAPDELLLLAMHSHVPHAHRQKREVVATHGPHDDQSVM